MPEAVFVSQRLLWNVQNDEWEDLGKLLESCEKAGEDTDLSGCNAGGRFFFFNFMVRMLILVGPDLISFMNNSEFALQVCKTRWFVPIFLDKNGKKY